MQVIYKCEFLVYLDCLDAIDDTHIRVKVRRVDALYFYGRKTLANSKCICCL